MALDVPGCGVVRESETHGRQIIAADPMSQDGRGEFLGSYAFDEGRRKEKL